jgi:triosephosphate isomerase (TIM)
MTQRIPAPIIAGNWKMNLGPSAAVTYFREFLATWPPREDRTVLFFPPAISFGTVAAAVAERPDVGLGVQNIHWEETGAFTGEISAPMAADAGARFALCGHSERRHVFHETDEQVGRKAAAALAAGLTPVICVGELLEERRAGRLEEVLRRQLEAALAPLPGHAAGRVLWAYEPVWAIGTGVNATPEDAAGAHAFLRAHLSERAGPEAGAAPILYGGSVKPDNAADLLAAQGVDGLLVGGASLVPADFARIAAAPAPRPGG